MDKNIIPGFHYKVRILGTDRFLFKGKALALQSIGIGYGKRITFEGESFNVNRNYFYSDTQAEGVAMSIIALQSGDTFVVTNLDGQPQGEGVIEEVAVQKELSTRVEDDKSIVKRVAVSFSCYIKHSAGYGLMPLQSEETFVLTAVAIVVKQARAKKAHTKFIEKLELPGYWTMHVRDNPATFVNGLA